MLAVTGAVLILSALAGAQAAATTETITVAIPAACGVSPAYYSSLSVKNSQGYRPACPSACSITSAPDAGSNFSVNQGDTLTVTFAGPTTYVFLGGALNDGFMDTSGCYYTATVGNAAPNSITTQSVTGFTFTPTGAVCAQFSQNTIGTLSVLAFDTAQEASTGGVYSAAACKFSVGVVIVPSAQSKLNPDQLFPLADGAAPLPGSMLKMLGMALLGALVMLVMLH